MWATKYSENASTRIEIIVIYTNLNTMLAKVLRINTIIEISGKMLAKAKREKSSFEGLSLKTQLTTVPFSCKMEIN